MLFYTWEFIALAGAACLLYWQLSSLRLRKIFLLITSYIFYACWDYRFLSLLLYVTLVDFVLGQAIHHTPDLRKKKRWLILSLCSNLGVLFFFKYFNFFADSLIDLAHLFHIEVSDVTLDIVLPVGISFYTFHSLSYIFDVYLGKLPVCKKLLDFSVYVAFFPPLIAGPIVRARDFLPQLANQKFWKDVPWNACLLLFCIGLIKKVCIADNIGLMLHPVFANPYQYSNLTHLLADLLFAIEVYCDFSGYADMAIATSRMFGMVIPVNFAWPLLATNISDLWRRWHISLGAWFRDYIFMPLGGYSRGRIFFTARNLILTMGLVGLWHGASWSFVIWGCLQGFGMFIYYLSRKWHLTASPGHSRRDGASSIYGYCIKGLAWTITYIYFSVSGIFFRLTDIALAKQMIIFSLFLEPAGMISHAGLFLAILAILGILHLYTLHFRPTLQVEKLSNYHFFIIMGLLLAFYTLTMALERPPFIYFQF